MFSLTIIFTFSGKSKIATIINKIKIFLIRVKEAFVASFLSECFFHKMLEINTIKNCCH